MTCEKRDNNMLWEVGLKLSSGAGSEGQFNIICV